MLDSDEKPYLILTHWWALNNLSYLSVNVYHSQLNLCCLKNQVFTLHLDKHFSDLPNTLQELKLQGIKIGDGVVLSRYSQT